MGLENGIKTALNGAICSEGEREKPGFSKEVPVVQPSLFLNADHQSVSPGGENVAEAGTADGVNSTLGQGDETKPNGVNSTLGQGDETKPNGGTLTLGRGEQGQPNGGFSSEGERGQAPTSLIEIDYAAPARGAGRPKGATNKSTKQWVEYFLTVCDSPLIALGKMYSEETAKLAQRLNCKEIEAFKAQVAAANAVLPYVHQKQPTLIDAGSDNLPLIQLTVSQTVYNEVVKSDGTMRDEFAGVEIDDIPTAEFEEIIEDSKN